MPPRPRHSRISSCGNNLAMSPTGKGGPGGDFAEAGSPVISVCVARFMAIRQRGQSPSGESGGMGAPHFGHLGGMICVEVGMGCCGGEAGDFFQRLEKKIRPAPSNAAAMVTSTTHRMR